MLLSTMARILVSNYIERQGRQYPATRSPTGHGQTVLSGMAAVALRFSNALFNTMRTVLRTQSVSCMATLLVLWALLSLAIPCRADDQADATVAQSLVGDFCLACNRAQWEKALQFFSQGFVRDAPDGGGSDSPADIVNHWKFNKSSLRRPLLSVVKTAVTGTTTTAEGIFIEGRAHLKRAKLVIVKTDGAGLQDVLKEEFYRVRFTIVGDGAIWKFLRFRAEVDEWRPDLEKEAGLKTFDALLSQAGQSKRRRAKVLAAKAAYLLELKDYKAGEASCKEGLALSADVQLLHVVYAGILKAQKRYAEAIEQYRSALNFKNALFREQDALREIERCKGEIDQERQEGE